jgi:hypothetical protein
MSRKTQRHEIAKQTQDPPRLIVLVRDKRSLAIARFISRPHRTSIANTECQSLKASPDTLQFQAIERFWGTYCTKDLGYDV